MRAITGTRLFQNPSDASTDTMGVTREECQAAPGPAAPPVDGTPMVERLAGIFAEHLHVEVPSPDTDLFETGILDSLQLVELLCQLEQHFDCRIGMDDLDLEHLRTLNGIAGLVAAHGAANRLPQSACGAADSG